MLTRRSLTIPDWPPEFIGRNPSTNSSWSILHTVLEHKFFFDPHPLQVRFKTVDWCYTNCWIIHTVPPVCYTLSEKKWVIVVVDNLGPPISLLSNSFFAIYKIYNLKVATTNKSCSSTLLLINFDIMVSQMSRIPGQNPTKHNTYITGIRKKCTLRISGSPIWI